MRLGRQIFTSYFNIIATILVVTVIYVGINMTLSWFAHWLEARTRRRFGKGVLSADVDTSAAA
ncbi:MAG: hypothetical protein ACRDV2_12205 [Actinomycetes bacterium]